jgi:hypothetical protein
MNQSRKLPAFQFYPGDWMKDPAVRSVSVAARGLWIDMLCMMFESPERGYLIHPSGNQVTDEQLARVAGLSKRDVRRFIDDLEAAGVFSKDLDGNIFSRRLVRDEQERSGSRERVTRFRQRTNANSNRLSGSNANVAETKRETNNSSSSSSSSSLHTPQVAPSKSVCGSKFSLDEIRRYVTHIVSRGEPIRNSEGLAIALYRSGEADSRIGAFLKQPSKIEKKLYPPGPDCDLCRGADEKNGQPCPCRYCSRCGSTGMEFKPGKGARHCRCQSNGEEKNGNHSSALE